MKLNVNAKFPDYVAVLSKGLLKYDIYANWQTEHLGYSVLDHAR